MTPSTTLSKRKLGVAALVAEGRTNREISVALGLTEHTVKNYLDRIFGQLNLSNRTQLARWYWIECEKGIVRD